MITSTGLVVRVGRAYSDHTEYEVMHGHISIVEKGSSGRQGENMFWQFLALIPEGKAKVVITDWHEAGGVLTKEKWYYNGRYWTLIERTENNIPIPIKKKSHSLNWWPY